MKRSASLIMQQLNIFTCFISLVIHSSAAQNQQKSNFPGKNPSEILEFFFKNSGNFFSASLLPLYKDIDKEGWQPVPKSSEFYYHYSPPVPDYEDYYDYNSIYYQDWPSYNYNESQYYNDYLPSSSESFEEKVFNKPSNVADDRQTALTAFLGVPFGNFAVRKIILSCHILTAISFTAYTRVCRCGASECYGISLFGHYSKNR